MVGSTVNATMINAKKRPAKSAGKAPKGPLGKKSKDSSSSHSVAAAYGSVVKTGRPRMAHYGLSGDMIVRHCEYLQDVTNASSFTATQFPIQPGHSKTFPWLSSIANRFESYRFRYLKFKYRTSCSSTQTGTVMLIPDYDAVDAAPASKVQGLSYRNCQRGQAWEDFEQVSASEDLHKLSSHFIRQGSAPAGTDLKTYDVGNLFLCVQGSDTNVLGEIWVDYEVELITPVIESTVVSGRIASGGTVSKTSAFGTAPSLIGTLDVSVSGSTVTFNQAFQGLAVFYKVGTTLVATVISGSTAKQVGSVGIVANSTDTIQMEEILVDALPGQTLEFDCSGDATVTAANVRIGAYTYANV